MPRAGSDRVGVLPTPRAARVGWPAVASLALIGVATVLLVGQLAPRLALFVGLGGEILRYPWVVDAAESVNIQGAHTLSLGQNPYAAKPRGFVAAPYPPVYLGLAALWLKIGGLNLFGGRIISLVGTVAVAALAALIVAREGGSRPAGLLAGALFLACGPTIVWAALYRQDLVALAFGLAGLCWLARWPGGRLAYGALPFFALAVYTKQTALAAPVAGCLYLLWRDRRDGLRFGAACAVALAAPLLPLGWLTGGDFWRQVVGDHAIWQLASFEKHLGRLVGYHAILLGLGAVGLGRLLRARRPTILAVYAPLGLATIVGSGAVGANNNHLLEPTLAACLLAGVAVGGWAADWRRPLPAAATVAALLLLAAQLPRMGDVAAWYDTKSLPSAARAARLDRVAEMIRQAQGEVFTDDSFLLLRAGKEGAYQNVPMLGALASAGRWDETPLLDDLAAHRFALLVIETDVTRDDLSGVSWSPAVLRAMRTYYRPLYRDILFTYAPRP